MRLQPRLIDEQNHYRCSSPMYALQARLQRTRKAIGPSSVDRDFDTWRLRPECALYPQSVGAEYHDNSFSIGCCIAHGAGEQGISAQAQQLLGSPEA